MVYAYLRVSTDKQQLENQRHEISLFARNLNMEIDVWVQESISGGIEKEVRSLGGMMDDLKSGDILIVSVKQEDAGHYGHNEYVFEA